MGTKVTRIIATGSSGYVASDLIPRLRAQGNITGIDQTLSGRTDVNISIESDALSGWLSRFDGEDVVVINLAAARFDFGATPKDYFRLNVECHAKFLESLEVCEVRRFIHISSVAALDGRNVRYSERLNCDDAYRATKYLQEELIRDWCDDRGIELSVVYPSAIFSRDARSDTNIGKLQSISKWLPFLPVIDVVKSLTFLPNLSRFIMELAVGGMPAGKYLAVERPSLTVSRMIRIISGRPIRLIRIPYCQGILMTIAGFLHVLGGFGRIDLKLTPNRVVKLFSDTSYSGLGDEIIDEEAYVAHNEDQLEDLLKDLNDP